MWKTYLQPTKSFKAKAKEPANVRERIQSLSEAISGLKQDVHQEAASTAMNFERLEKTQFNTLNSQVLTLKKAFTDLADAFVEEIEGLKEEIRVEAMVQRDEIFQKIDEIGYTSKQSQDNHHQLNSALTQTTKQAFQHIQTLKANQDKLSGEIEAVKLKFTDSHTEQKEYFDKFRKIIETNSSHISGLFKEQKIITQNLEKFSNFQEEINNEIMIEKDKYQETFEINQENVRNLNREIKELENKIKESWNIRGEIGIFKTDFKDLEKKIKELSEELRKGLYDIRKETDEKTDDIKRENINISDELLREIKDKSSHHVESRIDYLEELTTAQRRELFNSITAMEQSFVKKQEKVVRAIYQLARHQDLPEALLGI